MAAESSHSRTHLSPKQTRKKQLSPAIDKRSLKLPDLPLELILEILLRLPVNSLIRFKSVCKSWQTMISSPQFVKKHLDFVTMGDTINPWRIIVQNLYQDFKSYSLHSLFHEPYGFEVELEYPFNTPQYGSVVGSCNGLVCIYFWELVDTFYIWNPSTRETHALSAFGKEFVVGTSFGFGYDSPNDDYKVVRVAFVEGRHEVEVYSLRKDSWRRIGDFPSQLITNYFVEAGKLVNGSIHWAATNPSSHSWLITTLDLSEETYREVPQPNYESEIHDLSVIALRGRLCIVCEDAYCSVDLWSMNEYGIKESWTKLYSMPYWPGHGPFQYPEPLWCLKDGVFLVNCDGVFGIYDSTEHTFKYPLSHAAHIFDQADIYVESLVSPNAFMKVATGLNQ
ncbi:hypothetical protein RHMOL_Rhmol01G0206600 [Rhododendron molle]|uniref:Uncharacterized protein n=1 Tax=Rhododendron molle TaxID=49168 RepID=A0ACC0Q477_RHOML|nr:hypothetical protein RHMOL_Rhmol01G0206600 [Rhododendron molle]